jgi:hypothetical protein
VVDNYYHKGNREVPRDRLRILPRAIRLKDAPDYLGMDRNRFNAEVRPYVKEARYGTQSVVFDGLDLDAWFDDYMSRNGRRPKASTLEDDVCKRVSSQDATKCLDSARKAASGISRNAVNTPKGAGSVKARERLAALRRSKS